MTTPELLISASHAAADAFLLGDESAGHEWTLIWDSLFATSMKENATNG